MITRKGTCAFKPKVSELRESFDFIKASFAIEDIYFTNEELIIMSNPSVSVTVEQDSLPQQGK